MNYHIQRFNIHLDIERLNFEISADDLSCIE